MKKILLFAVVVIAGLGLCLSVAAKGKKKKKKADIEPGKMARLVCKSDPTYTYACYLPKAYDKEKKWNIIYTFDPDANGARAAGPFTSICNKHGWIVVGSNNAKNAPDNGPLVSSSYRNMWKDTHERFSLSEKGNYSSGFSGGSGMAIMMAQAFQDKWSGVIPQAAATNWAETPIEIATHVNFYFIIGSQDAVRNVKARANELKQKGNRVEVEVFSGAHQPAPGGSITKAVNWMMEIENEKKRKETLARVDRLLEEKKPYEAKAELVELCKKFPKSAEAAKAKAKIKKIDSDKTLKNEMKAGKIFAKSEGYEKKKKFAQAIKTLEQLISKLPDTEYAKRAKGKISELKAAEMFEKALKLEKKGKKADAEKMFRQIIEKYPGTEYAEKSKQKLENR